MKILEIGSVVLFGLLVAYTLLAAPRWTVATVRLAVDGGLLTIVLVSLGIGRPFTLQYARERVPEPIWALPVFFTTNRRITVVWAVAFAVHVAADAAAEYVPAVPLWLDSLRRSRPSSAPSGSPAGIRRRCSVGSPTPPLRERRLVAGARGQDPQ